MRKNIDIDDTTLKKVKLIAAYEDKSVKALLEEAVSVYVKNKELQKFEELTDEEKEDLGLLLLMQQNDSEEYVSEEEIFKILEE